jgi:hypothetical protein
MKRMPLLWLMLAPTLLACSPGDRGSLDPAAGAGVALVSTHGLPNDTARLSTGGVIADVTGRWSEQGESIEIAYRGGATSSPITIRSTSTWNGQAARASGAWDRSLVVSGNTNGRPLPEGSTLQLVSGKQTTVQIEYDRTGGGGPNIGDEVTITIPMPGEARLVRFRVAGE